MKPVLLQVENYRSLLDCQLPLRDLAVVIGPNGAGKTTLLEIFRLLQHSSQQELGTFLESQGGFQALLSYQVKGDPPHLKFKVDVDVEVQFRCVLEAPPDRVIMAEYAAASQCKVIRSLWA